MDDKPDYPGPSSPPQPSRTAEQLRMIQAAMMEELGIIRKDTLPLEDRVFDGYVPRIQPVPARVPTNAGVARWHNITFDDVDEATEQLDNIAGGQLYRLRRGAPSGPSQTLSNKGNNPSSRGGSPNNDSRVSRGGSPARGLLARGGRGGLSSVHTRGIRGGRGSSSGAKNPVPSPSRYSPPRYPNWLNESLTLGSTPSTFFNDARVGVNSHARIQTVVAMLRAAPRSESPTKETQPPIASKQYVFSSLASPQSFLSAMGVGMTSHSGSVPAAASTTRLEPKSTGMHAETALTDTSPRSSITGGANLPALSNSSLSRLTVARATPQSPQSIFSAVRDVPGSAQVSNMSPPRGVPASAALTAPAFANRSNGMATSRWSYQQPAASSSRISLSSRSDAHSEASVASGLSRAATSDPTPALKVSKISEAADTSAIAALVVSDPLSVPEYQINLPIAMGESSALASRTTSSEALINSRASVTVASDRVILMEKPAKMITNGSDALTGKVKLVKWKALNSIVLEFEEVENKNIPRLQQPLSDNVLFSSAYFTEITFTIGSDTYNVKFRFPHDAEAFEKLLPAQLKTNLSLSEHVFPAVKPFATQAPMAALNVSETTSGLVIESSTPVEVPTAVLNVLENGQNQLSSNKVQEYLVAAQKKLIRELAIKGRQEEEAREDAARNQKIDPKLEAIGAADNSTLPTIKGCTPVAARSARDDTEYSSSFPVANLNAHLLITLPNFNASDIANESVLIDLSEQAPLEVPSQSLVGSAHDYLICMNDDFIVTNVVKSLNNLAGGSFLHANRDTSAEELSSLVEDLTFSHLRVSPSFRRDFSGNTGHVYAKAIAKQALELAYAQDQGVQDHKRESTFKTNGISYNANSSTLDGEALTPETGHSQQMNGFQQMDEVQQVNEDHKPRKYSIQELIGLRDRALKLNNELPQLHFASRSRADTASPYKKATSWAQSSQDLPQPAPRPFKEQLAFEFASPQYQTVFQDQGSSNLKPAPSRVAASSSTTEKFQPLSQVTSEDETPAKTHESQTDPALYGSLLSAMEQDKSFNVKSKDTHHPADLTELTSLTSLFSDLKIKAPRQTDSTLLSNQQKTILETSNKKVEMERANVPGLSSSKWSSNIGSNPPPAPRSMPPVPLYAPSQPQYAPVYRTVLIPDVDNPGRMQAISGMEVIGTAPIVVHQLVSSPSYQDNTRFQTFPLHPIPFPPPTYQQNFALQSFPGRPDMDPHHTSNTSSTAAEPKFEKHVPTSPRDATRTPLSPRKANVQATFKESVHRAFAHRPS